MVQAGRRDVLKFMAAGLAGGIAVTGLPRRAAAQEVRKARLGHSFTDQHPRAIAMQRFAEGVEKATGGTIKVTVYSGSMLGSEQQMLQATQSGAQEFYLGALSPLTGKKPQLNIFDFPFLFANDADAARVLDGPLGRKLLTDLEDLNLAGLEWAGGAFRNIANNRRLAGSLEALKGLKIRVMQTKVAIDSFKAIGTNPVPMSYTEVYTALETHALDGHEHPLVDMVQNKMFEVEKYLTISNHVYTPVALVASKRWLAGLTPDQQAAIRKVAAETKVFERAEEIRQEQGAIEALRAGGMQVAELPAGDREKIRELVKPVIEDNAKAIGSDFVQAFFAAASAGAKP